MSNPPQQNVPTRDDLTRAIAHAIQAPSSHNSQPWRFRIRTNDIELRADPSRQLGVVDPDGRELAISCGAALFHLQCALAHQGHGVTVRVQPDPADPVLLARVECHPVEAFRAPDRELFDAIALRHTHRGPFSPRPVSAELLDGLVAAAPTEGAVLSVISDDAQRRRLAALVAEGDRLQYRDPAFRRELAAWMRPNRTARGDGLRGDTLGLGAVMSRIAPVVIRHIDVGRMQAATDHRLMLDAPAAAILWTERDEPATWIAAGRALAHVLLRAAAAGVSAGFMNQPVQCPVLRQQLVPLLPRAGSPQLVMRFGHAALGRRSSRRRVEEVLD